MAHGERGGLYMAIHNHCHRYKLVIYIGSSGSCSGTGLMMQVFGWKTKLLGFVGRKKCAWKIGLYDRRG